MSTAAPDRSIRKVVAIKAKPNASATLRDALATLERATRLEPGCRAFTFYQALTDEAVFLLIENFADAEALERHMQLPHTRTFFQAQLTDSIHVLDV
ncbi:MAG TPA: putative quinol monooxygenase [Burkholderiales bacterium]|nr:putative quinol monooxygenase [Burkholderiales bacterium]